MLTLADHAELWWREQGKDVPKEGTNEYTKMYEEWAKYAFKDWGKNEKVTDKTLD